MPELPDVLLYCEALERHFANEILLSVDVRSPHLLRTFEPPLEDVVDRRVLGFRRIGKQIVWELDGGPCLVFHLMIGGRFHRRPPQTKPRGKHDLAAFRFQSSTLMLTEVSAKKRAALHVVPSVEHLVAFDRGGLDVLNTDFEAFRDRLQLENHTLKRALTDPRLFDGIGNAYSDEILHAARLSPLAWTNRLEADTMQRLFDAVRQTLTTWIERLRQVTGEEFPEKVTAFRPGMAVHGRFGKPCPDCGHSVQRIRYAAHETNYCPSCQTAGKLLADRSLSRLLKGDWPKNIEAWESGFD